ncbi:MAG: hypothetical protein IPK64_07310 [bacterium]|nr:hypothetical protein [bacterium]
MHPGPQQQAVRRRRSRRPAAVSVPPTARRALAFGLLLTALAGTRATAQEAAADSLLAVPATAEAVPSAQVLPEAADAAAGVATPDAAPPQGEGSARAAELPAVNHWSTGVNATGAVLMTPLFPGWGQLYADGGWRAALAFGAEMYFWSNLLSRDRQARRDLDHAATLPEGDFGRSFAESLAVEHHEQMKDFVWWSGGALLIIALDAYVGAHLFNFDRDAVPVPDRWEDVFGPVGSGPAVNAGAGPEVTVFQWRKGF